MRYSHRKPTGKSGFYWNLCPILVQGWQYREHGQHLGDDRPHGRVCKVSPNTYPSAKSERNMFDFVWLQGTTIVQESLRCERVWVGEPGFVVRHRPSGTGH